MLTLGCGAGGLNPFFIRSRVQTIKKSFLTAFAVGLNPFFIRSRVQTARRQISFKNNVFQMGLTRFFKLEKLSIDNIVFSQFAVVREHGASL